MLIACVLRPGSMPKFESMWTGPRSVIAAEKVRVYGVQNVVSGEVKDVNVARLRAWRTGSCGRHEGSISTCFDQIYL